MKDDRFIQADWVGKSDWEYFGWKDEKEEEQRERAYDEYIDRLIDQRKEEAALEVLEKQNGKK